MVVIRNYTLESVHRCQVSNAHEPLKYPLIINDLADPLVQTCVASIAPSDNSHMYIAAMKRCLLLNRAALDRAGIMPIPVARTPRVSRFCRILDEEVHGDTGVARHGRLTARLPSTNNVECGTRRLSDVHVPPACLFI